MPQTPAVTDPTTLTPQQEDALRQLVASPAGQPSPAAENMLPLLLDACWQPLPAAQRDTGLAWCQLLQMLLEAHQPVLEQLETRLSARENILDATRAMPDLLPMCGAAVLAQLQPVDAGPQLLSNPFASDPLLSVITHNVCSIRTHP